MREEKRAIWDPGSSDRGNESSSRPLRSDDEILQPLLQAS